MARRVAAMPSPDMVIKDPLLQVGSGQLFAVMSLEDDPQFRVSFERSTGPEVMRAQLVAAILAWTKSGDGARRKVTVKKGVRASTVWLNAIEEWNSQHPDAILDSLEQMTVFHWTQVTALIEAKYAESTSYGFMQSLRALLGHHPLTPAMTKHLNKRRGARKAENPITPYPKKVQAELQAAALKVVRNAHKRISQSYQLARTAGSDNCPDPATAAALQELLSTGNVASIEGRRLLGYTGRHENRGVAVCRHQLFPQLDEIVAAAVLITLETGVNPGVLDSAPTPTWHDDHWEWKLDKPRRGPKNRFWTEIVPDAPGPSGANVFRLIVEMTEPLREYQRRNGQETERFLLAWAGPAGSPSLGVPASRNTPWLPLGMTSIDLRKLRRDKTSKEPTHHTADTNLDYVRSDPQAVAEHRVRAAKRQQALLDAAQEAMQITMAESTDPSNDTVVTSCADPDHHPETQAPCTSGWYSFLDCLSCAHAIVTPRHLPRLVAAHQVLDDLRGAMQEQWTRRFEIPFFTLEALLQNFSTHELQEAEKSAHEHAPAVVAALQGRTPR